MMLFQLSLLTSEAVITIRQFPVKVTRANVEGLAANCKFKSRRCVRDMGIQAGEQK
jgi:hypothetical protein